MTFYQKGVGRPTKVEQVVIDAIYKEAAQKGISVSELPMCHDLEELSELLRMVQNAEPTTVEVVENQAPIESTEPDDMPIPIEDDISEMADHLSADHPEPITEDTPEEPLEDAEEAETVVSEPPHTPSDTAGSDPGFIAPDYDPFSDPVIERSYTDHDPVGEGDDDNEPELPEDEQKTPLEDVSPHTKRRAAEQTARAILKGYAQVVPIPFKWLAKIPEEKVERMAFDGELDMSLEVEEGLTFADYMQQTNEQLDELFEVDEATLDDIREPLIDVLMEQQLELTPTQRLVMAVVSHLGQMLTIALKLRKQNNRILAYQQHITHMTRTRAA